MSEMAETEQAATEQSAPEVAAPETAAPEAAAPVAETHDADGAFVGAAPMERDPEEFFVGDRGVLDPAVRRVLVRILQRRVVFADRHKDDWTVLLENQQVIESRLHDLFIRLIVDPDRGVAYKQQVRSEELEVPVLLRDEAYNRAETLVLVYLRTVYQRESTAGEPSVRIDVEEIEQTVLSYFADSDGNTAARQKTIEKALNRLRNEGIIDEESEGRYLVTPLVEVVLSADRLGELQRWLKEQVVDAAMKNEDPAS
ncbi:uncharacterized protein DUF4194 [Leucobacter komagatae]|uniref:Uncharacterized protein DUF4194 n=2 Tax=Leucobacter komagatae TaxID=55969 RepID=A0A542Y2R7_9MICO|nr:uncharacterized protein DUF4194 [Leucobacter komagatae]